MQNSELKNLDSLQVLCKLRHEIYQDFSDLIDDKETDSVQKDWIDLLDSTILQELEKRETRIYENLKSLMAEIPAIVESREQIRNWTNFQDTQPEIGLELLEHLAQDLQKQFSPNLQSWIISKFSEIRHAWDNAQNDVYELTDKELSDLKTIIQDQANDIF